MDLNTKTVQFQAIQFCISTQFIYIWPINMTLPVAIILSQSGSGSDEYELIVTDGSTDRIRQK